MKSKLNRRRGFTIAEIIIAVAIMATLIAVLMKGLQTSRANIKRDTYQAELKKRALTIGAKAEAYVFQNGKLAGFTADTTDLEDPVGQTYGVTTAGPTKNGEYTVTISPATSGVLAGLGIQSYTYTFK